MNKEMKAVVQTRNDSGTNWTASNPILRKGEMGYDSSLRKFKIGDGTTAWNDLPYVTAEMSFDFGDEG